VKPKPIQESVSPIKIINKSINFTRKNSNEVSKPNVTSYKGASSNKHFAASDLNRSIESIQIKDKKEVKSRVQNTKNNELYCIQEEKEGRNDKNIVGIYDSFVSTNEDTKDGRVEDTNLRSNKRKKMTKHDDLLNFYKPQLEALITKNMKRTDGFMAFKKPIGGNPSNSLLPSSSGDTIINRYSFRYNFTSNNKNYKVDNNSDITHQTTSTTSDFARINKWKQFKRNQHKGKVTTSNERNPPSDILNKYKSRNKNQVICSKNTEPGVGVGSQHSSSSYVGFKTLYATNFV